MRIFLICLLVLQAATVFAQQPAGRKRPANPVLAPIEDDSSLPRVLLIGDSISMGYTLPVRTLLKGKANVHRPPTNCGPTTRGLEQLDAWLGEKRWDLIHFNFGLHDLKYLERGTQKLSDPIAKNSVQQVPIDRYEKNLREIVARLKKTGAVLIWRSTTPVPEGSAGRVAGDAARYNEVAEKIMRENEIAIDDMFSYSKPRLKEIQREANVHFTPEGSKELAGHVAKAISASLEAKTSTDR